MSLQLTFAFILSFFYTAAEAYDESPYKLVYETKVFEVRHYPERIVAEVAHDSARKSFRVLFGYISGNNKVKQTDAKTTPGTKSTKIEMTTPVTRTKSNGKMVMRFFLPSSFSSGTVPEPTDPNVEIFTLAAGHYGVIRYSGRSNERNFEKYRKLLLQELQASGLRPMEEAVQQPMMARIPRHS